MNAAEQGNSVEIVSKIAAVVNLFRSQFPDSSADLSPWLKNSETEKFDDPHSVDLAFHFYKRSFLCQSYSILMQIRLSKEAQIQTQRVVGVELSGHDYMGQLWRFATTGSWEFWGVTPPLPEAQEKLRQICHQIFNLFDQATKSSVTEL
ncbi:MAG: hypothetical protein KME49_33125 [Brasilonema octagenarum HA4186-MV1]|uniref:Uncharacterized protein n=1 Tax=Brasilonema octagenarum UFV-OR1 TaxID=417115 RepID=A0ABX1MIY8_9CYAN|nr:hypothetical protein [Brasilonema octagenarum]MBW4630225.1 hypothetical protein [Brasilonema octagenarum HA4186-MV1]NMF66824.1 hypothetical protein [Brasilonema octagenarum UFV-OR1]